MKAEGTCGCANRGDICYCPVEGVIEVMSRKYALPIVCLIGNYGSMRFNAIAEHFKGISPKTLTDRLKELEENRLVVRKAYSEKPPRVEYSLTDMGAQLRELVKPLMEWASKSGRAHRN